MSEIHEVLIELIKAIPIVLTVVLTAIVQIRKIDKNTDITSIGFKETKDQSIDAHEKLAVNSNKLDVATEKLNIVHDRVNGNITALVDRIDQMSVRLDNLIDKLTERR